MIELVGPPADPYIVSMMFVILLGAATIAVGAGLDAWFMTRRRPHDDPAMRRAHDRMGETQRFIVDLQRRW